MPHFSFSPPSRKRSDPPTSPSSDGGSSGIFTSEALSNTGSTGNSPSQTGPALSPKITEPFPDRLFRMPIPDAVFDEMPRLSDSALRALLALIRLSFRFDPDGSEWICPDRSFSRATIEAECGLSSQGTRNGLQELEDDGWISICCSNRSHEHTLELGVPERRYTYLPTDLLESAAHVSGTELRLVLSVLRATWGWTSHSNELETDPEDNAPPPKHRRWAKLSTSDLARRTGRSSSAIKAAAKDLQGTLLHRRRPNSGAYYYRFSVEALLEGDRTETQSSQDTETAVQGGNGDPFVSRGSPNDLPPERQRSVPPNKNIENTSKRLTKQSASSKRSGQSKSNPGSKRRNSAVHGDQFPSKEGCSNHSEEPISNQDSGRVPQEKICSSETKTLDLTGFSDRKRALGQKLANVGVWPSEIPELLGRYSAARIEVNFEYYRTKAPRLNNDGAFLASAIREGYRLPIPSRSSSDATSNRETTEERAERTSGGAPPVPNPGAKVSTTRKRALLRAGIASEEDFDKFKDYDDPNRKQHFYRVGSIRNSP